MSTLNNQDRKEFFERLNLVVGPISLECPCGKPLQIGKRSDGVWMVGHLEESCSHIVHSKVNKVCREDLKGTENDPEVATLGKILYQLVKALREDKFKAP